MSPDPRAALRDMMAHEMALRWRERARSGVEDSIEGHCVDIADAVMEQVFAGQVECRMVYAKPGQPIASYISAETLPGPPPDASPLPVEETPR